MVTRGEGGNGKSKKVWTHRSRVEDGYRGWGKWKDVGQRLQSCSYIGWLSLEIECTAGCPVNNTLLNTANLLRINLRWSHHQKKS